MGNFHHKYQVNISHIKSTIIIGSITLPMINAIHRRMKTASDSSPTTLRASLGPLLDVSVTHGCELIAASVVPRCEFTKVPAWRISSQALANSMAIELGID